MVIVMMMIVVMVVVVVVVIMEVLIVEMGMVVVNRGASEDSDDGNIGIYGMVILIMMKLLVKIV